MAGKEKLLGVQYLRAIAALMVVYFHVGATFPAYVYQSSWLSTLHLQYGVHIFFVISGFIMMVTTVESAPAEFLRRRLARIVPLYWTLTLAAVALWASPFHLFSHLQVDIRGVLSSLAFVFHQNSNGGESILVPGWTLNIEMFFYVVFALALLVRLERRLWSVGIAFAALVIVGQFLRESSTDVEVWMLTRPWMLEFVLGMAIGWIYLNRRFRLPKLACCALMAAGFAALLQPHSSGSFFLDASLPSVAIVAGAVAFERSYGIVRWHVLEMLGDSSYSLYLSHVFVIGAMGILWKRGLVHGETREAVFAVVVVSLAVCVAVVSYRLIERPALRLLTRRRQITSDTAGATSLLATSPLDRALPPWRAW